MKLQWKVLFFTAAILSVMLGIGEILILRIYPADIAERQYRGYILFFLITIIGVSTLCSLLVGYFSKQKDAKGKQVEAQKDELIKKVNNLEGQAERREEFIASFAHELKTPLTAIIGYADMIRSMDMPPKQRFTAAGYIFSEGKRLEALSLKLLDLIVVDKQSIEMREYESGYFMREVAAVCLPSIKENDMDLKIFCDRGYVILEGDLFKTLLINLVDNARKASKKGQSIDLIGKKEDNGYAFYIRDYGRGMSEADLTRITEPFYMVDKSRSRAQNGTGIGLALCQKIAQVHGTTLEYSSEPNMGTTARVFISSGAA